MKSYRKKSDLGRKYSQRKKCHQKFYSSAFKKKRGILDRCFCSFPEDKTVQSVSDRVENILGTRGNA